jgi:ankyrin repeat protein
MFARSLFVSGLLPGLALSALVGSLASASAIEEERGYRPVRTVSLACREMEQRYRNKKGKRNFRQLNEMLFETAAHGCLDVAKALIGEGASFRARDRFGNTPLLIAARSGENGILQYLLSLGSDVNRLNLAESSALLRAVTANRRKTVRLLLAAGADAQLANRQGITPLLAATFNGNNELFKLLLDAGADPTVVDRSGKGSMVYAAGKGYAGIVSRLLDAGIDVNRVYAHQLTALMWAAGHANDVPENEGLDTVNLLLERGAALDLADDRGRTALMIAAQRGHAAVVRRLIGAGADRSRRDKDGKTAHDLADAPGVREALAN